MVSVIHQLLRCREVALAHNYLLGEATLLSNLLHPREWEYAF